jgi:hypothetical protein
MGGATRITADQGNRIRLRLRAAGLPLEGMKWWITGDVPDVLGFEFQCDQFERLLTMAENNRKFGANSVSLPGKDPWRDARIESLGYSEIGVYDYLHLDIATNRDKLCRVYVAPHSWGKWHNALSGPPAYLSDEVYLAIAKRVKALGIDLGNYIEGNAKVGGTTLDGVTFNPANYKELAAAVQAAKANGNVVEGKKVGPKDGIDLSFLATSGTGFREISWNNGPQATLDFSALHFALSPVSCNIHIDEFGVVIGSTDDGSISLSANALHHIANELVLKTIIKDFLRQKLGLPPKYIDHLFVELINPTNKFNQVGGGIELHPWKSVKITVGYACNLFEDEGCQKKFTFTKTW